MTDNDALKVFVEIQDVFNQSGRVWLAIEHSIQAMSDREQLVLNRWLPSDQDAAMDAAEQHMKGKP